MLARERGRSSFGGARRGRGVRSVFCEPVRSVSPRATLWVSASVSRVSQTAGPAGLGPVMGGATVVAWLGPAVEAAGAGGTTRRPPASVVLPGLPGTGGGPVCAGAGPTGRGVVAIRVGGATPEVATGPRPVPPAAGDSCGISLSAGGEIGVATQLASAAITSAGVW